MDPGHSTHGMPNATPLSNASSASAGMAGHTGADMGSMTMYLFSSKTGFYLLFREAFVTTTGGFVGALFACFAFAALTSLWFWKAPRLEHAAYSKRQVGDEDTHLGAKAFVGAAAHGFKWLLHYICMLLVMSMNIWIILAVVLGHFVGFLGSVSLAHTLKSSGVKDDPDGGEHCYAECC